MKAIGCDCSEEDDGKILCSDCSFADDPKGNNSEQCLEFRKDNKAKLYYK